MEILILFLLAASLILFLCEAWGRIVARPFLLASIGLACWVATEILRQIKRV